MAIKDRKELFRREKFKIDCQGPEGNAHAIIGYARYLMRQLEWPLDRQELLIQEMLASDYENLIQVFDKHFGDYVDLYR